MIRVHVAAVLAVRDGFTGRAVTSGLVCRVDGVTFRPVVKDGGYWVFPDLEPGDHTITLSGSAYQTETVTVHAVNQGRTDLVVMLRPGTKYPFGGPVTSLTLQLEQGGKPAAGEALWLAAATPRYELKIAQDQASAGETQLRLYCKATVGELSLPRSLLLLDKETSEVCALWELDQELGQLAKPLAWGHKRGCSLYPAQHFTADETGTIRAIFRQPVAVSLLWGSQLTRLELQTGENTAVLRRKNV